MDEVRELLARQKISKALGPKKEGYECFVKGSSIGMGDAQVPCVLSSIAGQTAKVVIADGQDTGVEISVPLSSVAIVGAAKMVEAAKSLFRSK